MNRLRVFALALLAAGCASEPKTPQRFEKEWGTWKSKQEGVPAKVTTDAREVIKDAEGWAALWKGEPPAAVDFSKEMVLVVKVKLVDHPKDLPRVWRMRVDEDTGEPWIYVKVKQVGGDFKNDFMGVPAFHYVVVPRVDKEPHWRDIKVIHDADGNVDEFETVKNYDE